MSRSRWPRLLSLRRGPGRETVREHARQLLDVGTLDAAERERVALLLSWLDRPEPRGEFPGARSGVLDTARDEIKALWTRVHGSAPW